MINKKIIKISVLSLIILLNIFSIIQIFFVRKNVSNLKSEIFNLKSLLIEKQNHEDALFKSINDGINLLLDGQEESATIIQNDLEKINQKSDKQFSTTVNMNRKYEFLLEEQKKKTIDTAEADSAFLEAKKNALMLYEKGSYAVAYEDFRLLTETHQEDMECRLYKVKSLYKMNRADSSTYSELLDNLRILKQNAMYDNECLEIEKSILAEREGLNE